MWTSKTGPGLKIAFSLYDGKNARSINELKADQKQSFIIITAIFINNCNFLNVLYSNIFHSVPIQPRNVLIIWDLQFFPRSFVVTLWFCYGELARPGEINQFTLVSHSGLIVQKLYLKRNWLFYIAKWRNCLILIWFGIEPISLL